MRVLLLLTLILVITSTGMAIVQAENAGGTWTTLSDGTRIPVPPKEHPRLFLRAGDVEDVRARVQHPALKPTYENLLRLGEQNLHYQMAVDALRYLLTGDRTLGRRAITAALDTLPAAEWEMRGDYTRDIGRVMWAAAVVYDWCYDLLTPDEKQAVIDQFYRMAKLFEFGYPSRIRGNLTGHIAEWMIMRDLLSAGVAVYDEDAELYNEAAGMFFRDILPARNWF